MSSENEFDPTDPILRYRSTSPSVRIPPDPSDDEIAFDWTLSEKESDPLRTVSGLESGEAPFSRLSIRGILDTMIGR